MGKFKTEKVKDHLSLNKAHRMAEAFASKRAQIFLKTFLETSQLLELLKEKPDLTVDELLQIPQVDLQFGMAVALSYAIGFADRDRGASLKQLYVSSEQADQESPQLILPGFDDEGA